MMRGAVDLVVRRAWRGYAAARRWVARETSPRELSRLRRPRDANSPEWCRVTSDRHERYRADHPPMPGRVCVVCVSNRPHRLEAVAANVGRQCGTEIEFVFVPNGPGFDDAEIARAFDGLAHTHVMRPPAPVSLGSGLNLALEATDARFVAKFDDDDHYGARFLVDSMRVHGFAGAGVVGKHTYYASLVESSTTVLRFPGHEFTYSSTLAGGTLVIDRNRTGRLRFDDVSIGEDRAFLRACHRAGVSTYAGDRFNFVQRRGDDNTWTVSTEHFLEGCEPVDIDADEHVVDR